MPPDLLTAIQSITSPAALADLTTAYMDVKPEEKQEILETIVMMARIEKVSRMLAQRIEVRDCRMRLADRPKPPSTSGNARFFARAVGHHSPSARRG